jgi:hypothetical protein
MTFRQIAALDKLTAIPRRESGKEESSEKETGEREAGEKNLQDTYAKVFKRKILPNLMTH